MTLIQKEWLNNKLLIMDGIVFNDGRVFIMDINSNDLFLSSIRTNIESYLLSHPNYWGELVFQDSLCLPNDLGKVFCGGGAYGGDGFVTLVSKNMLIWSIFFQTTNPFIKIRYINGDICVTSGNGYELFVPYTAPEKLRIT